MRDEGWGWEILDPQGRSYMRAISDRRELLLGTASWAQLADGPTKRLKGSYSHEGLGWWGLTGTMGRKHWTAVLQNEAKIRDGLSAVLQGRDHDSPQIAVEAMQTLIGIKNVGYGTATLLLTLARPDRLLSLNSQSARGLGSLSQMPYSTLGKPENYRKLLEWLHDQSWYQDGPPTDEGLKKIWKSRAALVDSLVYEPT